MKLKELNEREFYINEEGLIYDNSLNVNNEDPFLNESKKRIKEIYKNQDEDINEVLEEELNKFSREGEF